MTPQEFTKYTGIAVDQEHLWTILEGNEHLESYNNSIPTKEEWCARWKRVGLKPYVASLLNELFIKNEQIRSLTLQKDAAERREYQAKDDREHFKNLASVASVKFDKISSIINS